jgi:hypothetical protein
MQVVRLIDLVGVDSAIRKQQIQDTILIGPAVMTLLSNVIFRDCGFEADPETLFIEVPEDKRQIGIVAVEDSTFTRCRFQNIAIIGTKEVVNQIRAEIKGAPPVETTEPPPDVRISGATGPAMPAAIQSTSDITASRPIGPTGATGPSTPSDRPPSHHPPPGEGGDAR